MRTVVDFENSPEQILNERDIERPSCTVEDHGCFQPHSVFRRIRCTSCGGMHWEPKQKALSFPFYPHCGAAVKGCVLPRNLSLSCCCFELKHQVNERCYGGTVDFGKA